MLNSAQINGKWSKGEKYYRHQNSFWGILTNLAICPATISPRSISLEFIFPMVPIDCVCGISYIRGKATRVNIGFRALTLASYRYLRGEKCSRAISWHDHGRRWCRRGSVRNIRNQCVPRGHIVNRAFRCWRPSTCYCSVFFPSSFLFSFVSFCCIFLPLARTRFKKIREKLHYC